MELCSDLKGFWNLFVFMSILLYKCRSVNVASPVCFTLWDNSFYSWKERLCYAPLFPIRLPSLWCNFIAHSVAQCTQIHYKQLVITLLCYSSRLRNRNVATECLVHFLLGRQTLALSKSLLRSTHRFVFEVALFKSAAWIVLSCQQKKLWRQLNSPICN
jgi:hypothetical protein